MKNAFWIRVDILLKTHGLTQREFAGLIEVSYNTYRNWKYNNRYPDVFSGCNMARVLGVEIEYLLKGKVRSRKKPIWEQDLSSEKAKILPFKQ